MAVEGFVAPGLVAFGRALYFRSGLAPTYAVQPPNK